MGQIISEPCADCGGEGRTVEERTYTVDVPAGVDTGSTLRLTGRGAVGPRGGADRRPLRARAGAARTSASPATATTCHATCPSPSPRPRSAPTSTFDTLDGDEDLVIPRGTQTGDVVPAARAGACPTCEAAAGATCSCTSCVDVPTDLTRRGGGRCCRQFAELRGDAVAPRRGRLPLAASARPSGRRRAPAADHRRARSSSSSDLDAPVLADGDRHHLERVLRLRAGDPLTVGDGAGPVATGALRRRRWQPVEVTVAADGRPVDAGAHRRPSRWSKGDRARAGRCRSSPSSASTASCRSAPSARSCAGTRDRAAKAAGAPAARRPRGGDAEPAAVAARGRRRGRPAPTLVGAPGAALADRGGAPPDACDHRWSSCGPEGGWAPTRSGPPALPRVASAATCCGPRRRRSPPVRSLAAAARRSRRSVEPGRDHAGWLILATHRRVDWSS